MSSCDSLSPLVLGMLKEVLQSLVLILLWLCVADLCDRTNGASDHHLPCSGLANSRLLVGSTHLLFGLPLSPALWPFLADPCFLMSCPKGQTLFSHLKKILLLILNRAQAFCLEVLSFFLFLILFNDPAVKKEIVRFLIRCDSKKIHVFFMRYIDIDIFEGQEQVLIMA